MGKKKSILNPFPGISRPPMPVGTLFYRPTAKGEMLLRQFKALLTNGLKRHFSCDIHSLCGWLLLFPEPSVHIMCIRLDIRVDMVFFTPKHDLISSHYTLPVLLTLFLEHSLHHISHFHSPCLLLSLLFKDAAWNFPSRKQQSM